MASENEHDTPAGDSTVQVAPGMSGESVGTSADAPPANAQRSQAESGPSGEQAEAGEHNPDKPAKKTRRTKRGGAGASAEGKSKSKKSASGSASKGGRKSAKPDKTGDQEPSATQAPHVAQVAATSSEAAGQHQDTSAQAPRVSSFGLIFQAPQAAPATPRRQARSAATVEDSAQVDEPAVGQADDLSDEVEDNDTSDGTNHDGDDDSAGGRKRRRRGGRGRRRGSEGEDVGEDDSDEDADTVGEDESDQDAPGDEGAGKGGRTRSSSRRRATEDGDDSSADESGTSRRRTRRRRRSGAGADGVEDPPGTVTKVREPRPARDQDSATGIKGSTRLEAKRQRRRDGREAGRRRTIITEAQFLARRESVERIMAIRECEGRTEIGVLEDGVLVEHYISGADGGSGGSGGATSVGNVYLGRVQNVLPSMEAAFVDIGKGRNAVLYAGEVNWDAAGLEANSSRRIENALSSGQSVLVQVTKDPIGHKGARLTSQVSLPGRFLVYVPDGSMTGISRKLPDNERSRLKSLLKKIVPQDAGVIVRTAAEGASEEELRADVERLERQWQRIHKKSKSGPSPSLLHGEPGLTVRVVRDVFNEDFTKLVVAGNTVWETVSDYVDSVAPDLRDRVEKWVGERDLFARYRIDEQLAKAMDRKVWLPSGGSLVIDRTEAMTVVDVNTGKFTGSGGNLEETVTKNNLEAAEEIVRQLRLRDIGGIIVVDFIDMVLESNRDLVVRRLVECLGRDRTKHQVAEVTSLGLVQMTRKRVGAGLIEVFSEPCEHCQGRGIIVHDTPQLPSAPPENEGGNKRGRRSKDGRDGKESGRSRSENSRDKRRNEARTEQADPPEDDESTQARSAATAHMAARVAAATRADGVDDSAPEQEAADLAETQEQADASSERPQRYEAAADPSGQSVAQEQSVAAAPARTRGARRGSRRAASAPLGGTGLTSAGLITVQVGESAGDAVTSLTQVAGNASVGDSGSGPKESESAAGKAATSAPRRVRRRASSPAGPFEPGVQAAAAAPESQDQPDGEPAGSASPK